MLGRVGLPLAHDGQLHALDLIGLTASVAVAVVALVWLIVNAVLRRIRARR
jgi:hypothetical protein